MSTNEIKGSLADQPLLPRTATALRAFEGLAAKYKDTKEAHDRLHKEIDDEQENFLNISKRLIEREDCLEEWRASAAKMKALEARKESICGPAEAFIEDYTVVGKRLVNAFIADYLDGVAKA